MFSFRDFPLHPTKEVRSASRSIYGANRRKSIYVVSKAGLSHPSLLKNLSSHHFSSIFSLPKGSVTSDVRTKRRVDSRIQLMISNSSYWGCRHKFCLPVRGQRTRTNANTQRSKRIRNKNISKK